MPSSQEKETQGMQENQNQVLSPAFNIITPEIYWDNDDQLFSHITLWQQKCQLIFDCQLGHASKQRKAVSIFLWSGNCRLEIYNSWCIKDVQQDNPEDYWQRWTA